MRYHRFNVSKLTWGRCINSRRIKRGGVPVRYTGWTVPTYNQSQQQYGYDQNAYNMNNYAQQGGQPSYQGQPQYENHDFGTVDGGNNAPGPTYYDATQTGAPGSSCLIFDIDNLGGYQAPAYPPPAGKRS